MPAKNVMIPLSQIVNRFDVRKALDEDRVLQLVGFYESGRELPPVELVQLGEDSYAYIDGRHRGAARAFCNMTDVPAIIAGNPDDPAELYARALEANWGGAKTPTRDDIIHTITRLLEIGASQTSIRERLNFLPPGSLKAYISSARSTMMKRKISKALDAIGEGEKIDEAAKKFLIPLDSLKDVVAGKKGRWGQGRSGEKEFAINLKNYISRELRSTNTGISQKMGFMLEKVEAGEMSYKEAYDVLKAWSDHLRKTGLRVADWRARLNAISGEQDKVAVTKAAETKEVA